MHETRPLNKAYLRAAIWLAALALIVLLPAADPAPRPGPVTTASR